MQSITSPANPGNDKCKSQILDVEGYPSEYPRDLALPAAHDSSNVHRRSSNLRARLQLLKQDDLSILERDLEKVGVPATRQLPLSSQRSDSKQEREAGLVEIGNALADYDDFVDRRVSILRISDADQRDVAGLEKWLAGNMSLDRDNEAYTQGKVSISLVASRDNALKKLEVWVEDLITRFSKRFPWRTSRSASRDANAFILSRTITQEIASVLRASAVILLLLSPLLIYSALVSKLRTISIVIACNIIIIFLLIALIHAKKLKPFFAGLTYAAALMIFLLGASRKVLQYAVERERSPNPTGLRRY